VNCAVNGDLCDLNGVTGYPQLNLYKDGAFLQQYKGPRDWDPLVEFLKEHTPPPDDPIPVPNPSGSVLALDDKTFQNTLTEGPLFVKFFAPWCGHCKKLAPTWKQLAKHMQSKLTIAEVNCDENSALCKAQGVTGYPMLLFYSEGAKSEYPGGRKLDQLKAFAEKASAPVMESIEPEELDTQISKNDVVYVLLHPTGATDLLKTITRLSSPLLGSPRIYTSPSQPLFERFSIPSTSPWALLALRDHDTETPSSIFHGTSASTLSNDESAKLSAWLLTNRLPTTMELTQDSFQSVMNAPHAPLVVIAAVDKDNKLKIAERFKDIGMKWRARTGGSGRFHDREVVFTWMDAERWADWMKNMYGIKKGEEYDELNDVPVVIADHSKLVYYDTDAAGSLIKLTSPSIFSVAEGAISGKISPKNSENFVERLARYLNHKIGATEAYVTAHPMHAVFLVGVVLAVVFLAVRRCLAADVARLDREFSHHRDKSSRLD